MILFARSSTVPPTMGGTLPHRNSILCAHCFNLKVGRGHGGRPKPPPGGPKSTLGSSSIHGPLHIERGRERDRERQRETESEKEREREREMRTLVSHAHNRCYHIKIIKMKKGDKTKINKERRTKPTKNQGKSQEVMGGALVPVGIADVLGGLQEQKTRKAAGLRQETRGPESLA